MSKDKDDGKNAKTHEADSEVKRLQKELELHEWAGKKTNSAIKAIYKELEQRKEELRKAHNGLEVKVKERTAELAAINDQLMQEVKERRRVEEELRESCDDLKVTLDGTVEAIAMIVDSRDPYTAGHQRRVAKLSAAIARKLNLESGQIESIWMAALVHDIGKLQVPAEILSRPRKLTTVEFSLIKIHSQVGYDILKKIKFPWPIAEMVLQHHERMNGSGYPAGLSGEEICLEARIIGVSDVVEAMSSHRPYRPALGVDAAIEEILKNKDILYDPNIVTTCVALIREDGFKID